MSKHTIIFLHGGPGFKDYLKPYFNEYKMSLSVSFCGETFDLLFSSYLEHYNFLVDLKNIKVPILNIYGENDLRFSKKVTTSFKDYNESIVDFEVLGAGHFPFLDLGNRE